MSRLHKAAAAVMITVVTTLSLAAAPAAAAELITNGGFETGALSPWSCSGSTGSVVSTPVRTGTKALRGAGTGSDNAKCVQTVQAVSGASYTLSAWVRGSYVYLGVTGGSATWTPNATDWTKLTLTFTAASSSVQVYLHGWYGTGDYYADDVSLDGQGGGGTAPGTPGTPVAGTITNTSIALSWAGSSGTVTGYRVYEGNTVVATPSGASATISGLSACTTHTYAVAAYNSVGESAKSGTVTVTTTGCSGGVPGIPGNPRVTTASNNSLALAWNTSTGTVTGYRVYEGTTLKTTTSSLAATITGLGTCETHTYAIRAYNSAGESGSATVTGTTTGCQTGTLPKHLLTGYWQNFVNGATPLRLSSVPTTYDIVAVAFADSTATPGAVTFTLDSGLSNALGGYTDAQFKADIATLKARNQKVILSVGGEKGSVAVNSSAAATAFANSVTSLINTYGFNGVDIDLENGLNATYMEQALRSIRASVGAGLIITMAPQTIDMQSPGGNGYFALALAIKDILTIVHTQFYNSGGMLGCDQMFAYSQGTINFITALACIQLQSALRPDQVALGLPATTQAAGGGYVSPTVVNNALSCLAAGTSCGSFVPPAKWPSIRGAMTWSINWDASNGYAFATSVHNHLVGMP